MSPGNYLVAITKVDAALTNNNDVRLTYTLRSILSVDKTMTYGITMYRNSSVNRADPFWRNFLTSIGHTEETLPTEALVFQTKAPMQKVLDELFIGKTGWIYHLPNPLNPGQCTIKWLKEAPNVLVE